ncbi:MAG: YggU family protein [Sulfuricella sp.]|nr:YggU family protein [Sulfuricella sp.]
MSWFQRRGDNFTLTLHIQPGAKRTEIAGLHGDALKIRVAAPPVEGAANAALLDFLKKIFAVRGAQITLKQGASGRHKVVEICGSTVEPESLLGK